MKDFFIKLFTDFNTFLIRISRGRIGSKLGTQTILLLETTGRKTGQPREVPIAYFFHLPLNSFFADYSSLSTQRKKRFKKIL